MTTPPEPPAETSPPSPLRRRLFAALAVLLATPPLVFAAWTWAALHYSYSTGERAGFVQKVSKKGWVCKTWEGELAMANLPGSMPQLFTFSVRDEGIAREIERTIGRRVSLSYEQHRGVPTTCFGETEYFVTRVQPVGDASTPAPTPASTPGAPAKP